MGIKVNCKHFDGFIKCNFKPKDKILYWCDHVFWEIKPVCVLFRNCMSCEDQDSYPKPKHVPPPPPPIRVIREDVTFNFRKKQ